MKKFEDLEFERHPIGDGIKARMNFDNDYGVSVIRFSGSYGNEKGLYEVAVLYKDGLTYNTHITNDVLGWQTEDDVTDVMKKVQQLK